jgi:hypothetical protein
MHKGIVLLLFVSTAAMGMTRKSSTIDVSLHFHDPAVMALPLGSEFDEESGNAPQEEVTRNLHSRIRQLEQRVAEYAQEQQRQKYEYNAAMKRRTDAEAIQWDHHTCLRDRVVAVERHAEEAKQRMSKLEQAMSSLHTAFIDKIASIKTRVAGKSPAPKDDATQPLLSRSSAGHSSGVTSKSPVRGKSPASSGIVRGNGGGGLHSKTHRRSQHSR